MLCSIIPQKAMKWAQQFPSEALIIVYTTWLHPRFTQQPLGLTCSLVTFVGFSIILVSSFYWSSCLMYFILSLFKIAHFISGLGSLFLWWNWLYTYSSLIHNWLTHVPIFLSFILETRWIWLALGFLQNYVQIHTCIEGLLDSSPCMKPKVLIVNMLFWVSHEITSCHGK